MRDPYLQKILEALNRELDPNLFEECVVDLLRHEFPRLVPVPGGNDAGMDGAIADGIDEPFPLVTTTGKDLLGNLRKNLKAHKRKHRRSKAVFATSRPVSGEARRKLHSAAEDLGFVLVQIYGRRAIALRLYRDPIWCKALLGLTGDPPSLSAVPLSSRPLLNSRVIGRSKDLKWLRGTPGDRVLVGQPGIGKSFVLSRYARSGDALFVIDDDRTKIANGVREQSPKVLIVDDAHGRMALLQTLRHLRKEIHADYSIVAVCWPGSCGEVREALCVPKAAIRHLELMTRDKLVAVVNDAGIFGPNELVREIVNQARGRAGLAVSLVHACLLGDVHGVASADILRDSMVDALARLVDGRAREILAAFALGGDMGMTIDDVAESLRMDTATVRACLRGLAEGGVVTEVPGRLAAEVDDTGQPRCAVQPPALQHALVRDVFFGTPPLSLQPILQHAPSVSALSVLISAKLRGADRVSSEFLRSLFPSGSIQAAEARAWVEPATLYAHLGAKEAQWVLENFPQVLDDAPAVLLERAGRPAIMELLGRAVGDTRPLNSTPNHPFRVLGSWIAEHRGDDKASMRRRRAIIRTARKWLSCGGDQFVGLEALSIAFNPFVERDEPDPGSGNKFIMSSGFISTNEAKEIEQIWGDVARALGATAITNWRPVIGMIESWVHPAVFLPLDTALDEARRAVAQTMIHDLAPLAGKRPGVLLELRRLAGGQLEAAIDGEFETVIGTPGDSESEISELCAVARAWAPCDPDQIAGKIAFFLDEAERAGRDHRLQLVSDELARLVTQRLHWADALLKAELPGPLIEPFLRLAAQNEESHWATTVSRLLGHASLQQECIKLALTVQAPDVLFEQAMAREVELAATLLAYPWIEISEGRMARLLSHTSAPVAAAAALKEWRGDPRRTVRNSLHEVWYTAILRVEGVARPWGLVEIFRENRALALEWLLERIRLNDRGWTDPHSAVRQAINMLTPEDRAVAIRQATWVEGNARLLQYLVAHDPALFEELLQTSAPSRVKLAALNPLDDAPSVHPELIALALGAGYGPRMVVDAVYGHRWSFHGPASAHWKRWIDAFAPLTSSDDPKMRAVGRLGRRRAKVERREALQRERNEAVFGR